MLTNWYVRRSRQRFFDESVDAFDALYTALETVSRVAAPLLPLVSEEIWRGLTGGRSVHLADWPDAGPVPGQPGLVEAMDRVQQICPPARRCARPRTCACACRCRNSRSWHPARMPWKASPPSSPMN